MLTMSNLDLINVQSWAYLRDFGPRIIYTNPQFLAAFRNLATAAYLPQTRQ